MPGQSIAHLHLAILESFRPSADIQKHHGSFVDMVQAVFDKAASVRNAGNATKVTLSWDTFNVLDGEYPLPMEIETGKYQGIVITGSTDNAYGDEPWKQTLVAFIQGLIAGEGQFKVPMLGICFGHQIIARACGVPSEQNPRGWELGPCSLQLTSVGQHVLQTDKTAIVLNQFHEDHVPTLPKGFVNLATTAPHTPVQVMISEDSRCLTVQGHPEITTAATSTLVDKYGHTMPIDTVCAAREQMALDPALEGVWLTDRLLSLFLRELPLPTQVQ
ncbi:class I glutamine amidotransferase-like protein [Gongronella butleri]|nr:class I glutamine amidotransferase-like protein [Gongronella butleri]